MSESDETLTLALEAFCKRLIEGHPEVPTGATWERDLDMDTKNKVKDRFIGPLHSALQAVEESRQP